MASLITNRDTSKLFLGHNRFSTGEYVAAAAVDLAKGTLLGRITSTGKVVPFAKGGTTGEAVPLGILADDYKIAGAGTVQVKYCDTGLVDESLVILPSGDTLDTVITGVGIIRDAIQRNTLIKLEKATELTKYDNQ